MVSIKDLIRRRLNGSTSKACSVTSSGLIEKKINEMVSKFDPTNPDAETLACLNSLMDIRQKAIDCEQQETPHEPKKWLGRFFSLLAVIILFTVAYNTWSFEEGYRAFNINVNSFLAGLFLIFCLFSYVSFRPSNINRLFRLIPDLFRK